ncbi:MAG: GIY-YIG nuclease family protein [Lachnospiraceae bacterium]|nr:GIY-YIG nuclease family protein [Lachnospiraceae bacterium]
MNCTYILECGDGSFYTGWTNNIEKRLEAHRSGAGAKYTRGRGPIRLVCLEVYETQSEAMHREAYIKRLTRIEKLAIIHMSDWKEHLAEWGLADLALTETENVP